MPPAWGQARESCPSRLRRAFGPGLNFLGLLPALAADGCGRSDVDEPLGPAGHGVNASLPDSRACAPNAKCSAKQERLSNSRTWASKSKGCASESPNGDATFNALLRASPRAAYRARHAQSGSSSKYPRPRAPTRRPCAHLC